MSKNHNKITAHSPPTHDEPGEIRIAPTGEVASEFLRKYCELMVMQLDAIATARRRKTNQRSTDNLKQTIKEQNT